MPRQIEMKKRHGPSPASASSSSCSSSDSAPPACGLPGRKDTPSPKDGCSTMGDDSYSTCIADAFREKKRKERAGWDEKKRKMEETEVKQGRRGGFESRSLLISPTVNSGCGHSSISLPGSDSLLFYYFQCKKQHMKTPSRNLFQANSQSKQH